MWHIDDPYDNGIPLLKYFESGEVLHAKHPQYTDWVRQSLENIAHLEGDALATAWKKLQLELRGHIQKVTNTTDNPDKLKLNEFFSEGSGKRPPIFEP
jgi:hypothetical protein